MQLLLWQHQNNFWISQSIGSRLIQLWLLGRFYLSCQPCNYVCMGTLHVLCIFTNSANKSAINGLISFKAHSIITPLTCFCKCHHMHYMTFLRLHDMGLCGCFEMATNLGQFNHTWDGCMVCRLLLWTNVPCESCSTEDRHNSPTNKTCWASTMASLSASSEECAPVCTIQWGRQGRG